MENGVADDAKDIIKEERARRKSRPRKEEGGTKEMSKRTNFKTNDF